MSRKTTSTKPSESLTSATDTIVAEATPPGRGGLSLVRLAGPLAQAIAARVFLPRPARALPWPARRVLLGHLALPGDARDRATAVTFHAPDTYTGDDIVELGVHGSPVLVSWILDACTEAGARLARPGEFAHRALLAGKLSLLEAEALDALIHAPSPAAARAALAVSAGGLAREIDVVREALQDALAEIEAAIDFDHESAAERRIGLALDRAWNIAANWEAASRRGVLLERGFVVALAGPPNAGKSSLFNALLDSPRAIVTPEPGTTRDVLEAQVLLEGYAVTLLDTAGERDASSEAEREGVRRMRVARESADLVLEVRDPRVPESQGRDGRPDCWRVFTHADLEPAIGVTDVARTFAVSSPLGTGIETLRTALAREARERASADHGAALLNARQRGVALATTAAIAEAQSLHAAGQSDEIVASCVRFALTSLAELAGHADIEDMYARIFSRFCVGK